MVKNNTKVAINVEVTEGTYVPPAAGSDFLSPLADGLEFSPSKELLERNNLNSSIGKSTPRTGTKSVTGTIPVEAKSNGTEGAAPEYGLLIESCLGAKRAVTTTTADDTDAGGPHTTTRIFLLDADASKYAVGDIVHVKVSGDHHVSPVTAVNNTGGDVYIDLLVAADNAFSDGDVISAVTTYLPANTAHPTFSMTKYMEDARREFASGCRVNSMTLNNFVTGQLADFSFGFEGLSWDSDLSAPGFTPSLDAALPPIVLEACIYQDGVQIDVNEVGFAIENTLGNKTSTCSANGKISSRITERAISGNFNPYKQDDDIANFNRFKNNTAFSLFGFMSIPSGVTGEIQDIVAFYMPNCLVTEYVEADQDGLLQEGLTFSANRGSDGTSEEIYISMI